MTTYTPSDPQYSGSLQILESTDAVSDTVTNTPLKQLMDNDAYMKASIDLLMENGIKVTDVAGASVSSSGQDVTIVWSDPADVTSGGATIAEWAGTKLVRKVGSAPTSMSDGTVILDNQVRNAYSVNGYVDTGREYGTTYYYRFFPYTRLGAVTTGMALNITPAREQIALPEVSGSLTYDGTEQTMTFTGYDSTKMDATGLTGTNAGDYTASFTPKAGCQWTDGTMTAKTVAWSIAKAAGSATLSTDSVTLDADHLTASVTITNATGTISGATTSDDQIATASVSGSTVVISNVSQNTGTATITVSIAASSNYLATTKEISVDAVFTTVYGVEWDGTSTSAFSRTDAAAGFVDPSPAVNNGNGSSPFDNLMPWSGMQIVDDATVGKLVAIPKYYYKWTRNGSSMKLQIADGPQEGFHVSPAHADRGDNEGERDVVYVARYHCASSTYKSTTGVKPEGNHTRSEFRSSIHNLGTDIWQYDYAMYWTIMMLYLVEYGDWNSQAKIGYGCGNNSSTENMGSTDGMTYHTGTNASSRTTYGHTQYRHIEDLWGNVYDWVDGIYFSSADIYCIKNPASFSDSTGGTKVGTRATTGGWTKGWTNPSAAGFEYALYPNSVDSNLDGSTYICDYCDYGASGVVLHAGGSYYRSQACGAFYLNGSSAASDKSANIGSRLQKLPPAA